MRSMLFLFLTSALLGQARPVSLPRPSPLSLVSIDAGRVLTNDKKPLTAYVSGLTARRVPPRVVRGEGLAIATIEPEGEGWRVTLMPDYHAAVRGEDGMSHLQFEVISGVDYVSGEVLCRIDDFAFPHPFKLGLNAEQLKADWLIQAPLHGRGRWVSAALETPDDQVRVVVTKQKSGGLKGSVIRKPGPPRPLVQNRLVFTSNRGETDFIQMTTM